MCKRCLIKCVDERTRNLQLLCVSKIVRSENEWLNNEVIIKNYNSIVLTMKHATVSCNMCEWDTCQTSNGTLLHAQ